MERTPPGITGSRPLIEGELTESIIGCFFRVYRALPRGCREHLYALALQRELTDAGLSVEREKHIMVYYRGQPLARQKLDMVVNGKVIVEIKASVRLPSDANTQVFGYLAVTNLEVGLLLHFGEQPKFYRIVYENRLKERPTSPATLDHC
ncbi:MAG TPA: GxxExxY protein [Gemmatimonadaceae bacterium]|jgi:GxxExxY protein|nr:GxxExxY protein [Gemmatimonadaceae bacterium]